MSALITQSDVRNIRRLAESFDADEFDAIVNEVQEFYLESLIGAELFEDLINNPTSEPNAKLLCGEYYTYSGTKYKFKGAKVYLCYLWLYKYSLEGQVKYTNSGRQNFDVDYAQKSQKGIDAQVINNFLSKSQAIGEEILLYLERNSDNYSLYKSEDTSKVPNKDFNFTVFGKTFTEFKAND